MSMKRLYVDGKVVNKRTADMLNRAEQRLGYPLYILQGSYNSGVSASAGTHDGGGAIDVSVGGVNKDQVVLVLRQVGFAAWYRPTRPGVWNEHIHAIAIGDPEMSSGARNQVQDYYAGRDGLAGNGPDNGPRLNPIPTWPQKLPLIGSLSINNQFKAKNPKPKNGVRAVQRALNWRLGLNLKVDGVAGKQTREAWKKWQKATNSTPDGIARRPGIKKILEGFARVV